MDNKTLVRTFLDDVFNKRDLSKLTTYFAANCNIQDGMTNPKNLTELRTLFEGFHKSFTDMRVVTEAQIAEGDLVCTRMTISAKDTGGFMGKPASGKKATISVIQVDRIRDAHIQQSWVQVDWYGLLQQLNLIPRLEPAKTTQPYQPSAK